MVLLPQVTSVPGALPRLQTQSCKMIKNASQWMDIIEVGSKLLSNAIQKPYCGVEILSHFADYNYHRLIVLWNELPSAEPLLHLML
jgi:hypothetical protein